MKPVDQYQLFALVMRAVGPFSYLEAVPLGEPLRRTHFIGATLRGGFDVFTEPVRRVA